MKPCRTGIFALLLLFLAAGCRTVRPAGEPFGDLEKDTGAEREQISLKLLPDSLARFKRPDHIIDDFEKGIRHWSVELSERARAAITEVPSFTEASEAILLRYDLINRKQFAINPEYARIRIEKDSHYQKYRGVEFYARAKNNFRMKVLVYERNRVEKGLEAVEIWYKEIRLTSEWRHYRVLFEDLQPEEYFEQDFMGDDLQQAVQFEAVGFYIGNDLDMNHRSGEIWLDDIFLF